MERCWEYLGCNQRECSMYGQPNGRLCWEMEDTLCNHHGIELMRNKLGGAKEKVCARVGCIYYRKAKNS